MGIMLCRSRCFLFPRQRNPFCLSRPRRRLSSCRRLCLKQLGEGEGRGGRKRRGGGRGEATFAVKTKAIEKSEEREEWKSMNREGEESRLVYTLFDDL